MRRNFLKVLFSAAIALGIGAPALAAEPVKVVYHFVDGIDQAARGMGNIRNHLRGEPGTRIVAVALGAGIDFLLDGAKDRNGRPFADQVAALAAQGVEFKVCNNTLQAREISTDRLLPQAKIVQAGVVEIARLQAREGYVYIRP
jgi:uncharacterized protein